MMQGDYNSSGVEILLKAGCPLPIKDLKENHVIFLKNLVSQLHDELLCIRHHYMEADIADVLCSFLCSTQMEENIARFALTFFSNSD